MTVPGEPFIETEIEASPVDVRIVEDVTKVDQYLNERLRYVDPIFVSQLAGSGTTTFQHNQEGWIYDIRRVTVASFTAGSVIVYKNQIDDSAIWFEFSQAGTYTLSKDLMLNPNDTLIFVASGITGNVTPSLTAWAVRRDILAEYVM